MPVIDRIAAFHDAMTEWRRDLHRHPELGLEEQRTSAVVRDKLRAFGADEVVTGLAGTGVIGIIRGADGGASGRAIGLRADMDALPIREATGLPWASATEGVMHACGHDGHTAMLLGAARYLAETRRFDGTVYVIFQPAEENVGGGDMMVREGLFERFPMQSVFGLHNWPEAPEGTFLWRAGPMMAAVVNIEIDIIGKGAHGALPHNGIDPVVVAAQIVMALQTLVSRSIDPLAGGVVTIGHIVGGDTHNVIPERVRMRGTGRWFDPTVGERLQEGVRRLATGIAASFGARAEVTLDHAYPPVVNDPAATAQAVGAARAVAGDGRVVELERPTMGAEDFAFMLKARPGSYLMLGGRRGPDEAMVHHPRYDFNDALLPIGASYWATLAEQLLPRSLSAG